MHFIHYSTEQAFGPGSVQHDWVKAALARVDRTRTPWLVFSGHRPMYIDSTDTGPPGGDQFVAEKLRVRCGPSYSCAACCDRSYSRAVYCDPSYSSQWERMQLCATGSATRTHVQDAFEDLLIEYHVDLTFHGHHHSYQRTCPAHRNKCVGYGEDGVPLAPIHLVIGNAGAGLTINIHPKQPEVRFERPRSAAHLLLCSSTIGV